MQIAFLGLPRSGKSTLFEAIVDSFSDNQVGKGSSLRVRTGQAKILDPRITKLAEDFVTRSTVYASIRFVDLQIPDGVLEAGKPLPAQLLTEYRGSDALVLVIRAFTDSQVFSPDGVDPLRDAKRTQDELVFNDYLILSNRLDKIREQMKRGIKDGEKEQPIIERLAAAAEESRPLRLEQLDPEEEALLGSYGLLSRKPGLLVVNADEDGIVNAEAALREWATAQGLGTLILRGKVEQEIAQLPIEERAEFLEAMGLAEAAANAFVQAAFSTIGIQQFFTAGEQEVRAWTILKGDTAWAAAGAIHTDIQKHFIRAEVCAYNDYATYGDMAGVKAAGKYRLEKKEYVVQEGDIIYFRHSG